MFRMTWQVFHIISLEPISERSMSKSFHELSMQLDWRERHFLVGNDERTGWQKLESRKHNADCEHSWFNLHLIKIRSNAKITLKSKAAHLGPVYMHSCDHWCLCFGFWGWCFFLGLKVLPLKTRSNKYKSYSDRLFFFKKNPGILNFYFDLPLGCYYQKLKKFFSLTLLGRFLNK